MAGVCSLSLSASLNFSGPAHTAKRITPMLTLDDMAYLAVPDPAVCNVCSHGGSVLSASVNTANTYRRRKKNPSHAGTLDQTSVLFCLGEYIHVYEQELGKPNTTLRTLTQVFLRPIRPRSLEHKNRGKLDKANM